ncbi:sigma-70 family RNA polymerase sigma factor [Parapedobacter indicus]|uniref:RNA polymerase sigma-70 factor, ECF subfamily n=1 Tax=Parapedobacter indicus TaxID=1477437 RepID=A0A1I3GN06_9SPHI|nr:sigma-70 family RNA polymerase sigma factor [Parapedobacter indicus]PPL02717.1 RNA polymerase sigma-70 factor (ECF subfamily) [Parapedobacter indicus]SFI24844.1 RNA polymerase sigma-70 factor, ECF subfamily [Parapedobacter indicus]
MHHNIKNLRDFKLGRESGLKYLMLKFGNSLRFFAYSIIRNKEAAEEIVSDLFYKLWERREQVESLDKIKAFLFISARNACYDYLDLSTNRIQSEPDPLAALESQETDILNKIIFSELVELIVKEVNKLPKQQAVVFRMSFLEGMTTEEICAKLGTSIGNVYFAKSKAISTLRSILERKDLKLYTTFFYLLWMLVD